MFDKAIEGSAAIIVVTGTLAVVFAIEVVSYLNKTLDRVEKNKFNRELDSKSSPRAVRRSREHDEVLQKRVKYATRMFYRPIQSSKRISGENKRPFKGSEMYRVNFQRKKGQRVTQIKNQLRSSTKPAPST